MQVSELSWNLFNLTQNKTMFEGFSQGLLA